VAVVAMVAVVAAVVAVSLVRVAAAMEHRSSSAKGTLPANQCVKSAARAIMRL
jgi:hypothetical protein